MRTYSTLLLIFSFFFLQPRVFAQKQSLPIIDTSVVKSWNSLINGSGIISNNGMYAGYAISSSSFNKFTPDKFFFKSLTSNWGISIDSVDGPAYFTDDCKYGIALSKNNHLHIQELGTDKKELIPDVKYFILRTVGKQQYLVYFKAGMVNEMMVRSLKDNISRSYSDVIKCNFSDHGDVCYLICKKDTTFGIDLLNVTTGYREKVWGGSVLPSDVIADRAGSRICFKVDSTLFYLDRNSAVKCEVFSPKMDNDCKDLRIATPDHFSPEGKLLFVKMQGPPPPPLDPAINPVQVFSYQDGIFDIDAVNEQRTYLGVYETNCGKFVRIEYDNEKFRCLSEDESKIIISKREGAMMENYWNQKGLTKTYILTLQDSKRIQIDTKFGNVELSPSGEYALYQNDWKDDIYCLHLTDGKVSNLTKDLPIPLKDNVLEMPLSKNSRELDFYNWLDDGHSVLVYDRFDIWQLDLTGRKAPVNLTNYYGRKHQTVFIFCQLNRNDRIRNITGNELVVSAFNEVTKDNGFYTIGGEQGKDPKLLTMGRYVFLAPGQNVESFSPVKAKDRSTWLVWRMSASESPNYFQTSDFKTFKELSNIHPENNYQWYNTELINFKTKDGVNTQAVLYKPNNFDSTKQYPVLFNYYEHESAKLNAFLTPEITDNYCFNYPMMLARGYLICLTDIHFKEGETAHSIVDAVEGAGSYLSRRPYVDSLHYGVAGGSFAGYASNCLATFSHKFSAAVSISGVSDLVGGYGNVPGLRDEEFENRQFRMGVSLSTDPYRYLHNSPVAYTKDVTTPILIVNTLIDWNVNVQQGIEFFISLRREGKRAWMLRYQYEGHGIFETRDKYDLYTRMNQFFDHYLKGAPAPIWMTRGIPVNEIGVKSGFEYDTENKTPLPSQLLFKTDK